MRLVVAPGISAEVKSALSGVARALAAGPLAEIHPDVTAFVGPVDPLEVARAPGPVIGVPLGEDGEVTQPAFARASAMAAFDTSDLCFPSVLPLVDVGMPEPAPAPSIGPIDPGPGTAALARALLEELDDDLPEGGPGVTWVRGTGVAPRARAAAAWRAGRAVVALPGTEGGPLFARAQCDTCPTSIAALELTRLLVVAPPLARVFASRGCAALESLPTAQAVSEGFLEAAELAASPTHPGGVARGRR